MPTINRVYLQGRLGDTPALTMSKNNRPYVRLRIATDRQWMNAGGITQSMTDWHMVFVWGWLAEFCATNLRKDCEVSISGQLTYWREGIDKLGKSAIQAEQVQLVDTRQVDNPEASRNHDAVAHLA